MTWSNQAVTLILLVEDATGFSGLFAYSPSPGNGNLIFSVAATSGMDPYGNTYQAGATSYNPLGGYTQVNSGNIVLLDENNHRWEIDPTVSGSEALLQLQEVGAGNSVFLNSNAYWLAQDQNSPSNPETWHTVTSFGTGFEAAVGQVAPAYRFEPVGSAGVVRLRGVVETTAATAAGATMFALPANYNPANLQQLITRSNFGGAATTALLTIQTGGNVQSATASTAAGQLLSLDGITFPLD